MDFVRNWTIVFFRYLGLSPNKHKRNIQMNENQKKYYGSLEINDLIDDAVKNAVARRSDLEDTLSDKEASDIAGGINASSAIVLGRFPITTVGIVYLPPKDILL
jgi:hypothetical protein